MIRIFYAFYHLFQRGCNDFLGNFWCPKISSFNWCCQYRWTVGCIIQPYCCRLQEILTCKSAYSCHFKKTVSPKQYILQNYSDSFQNFLKSSFLCCNTLESSQLSAFALICKAPASLHASCPNIEHSCLKDSIFFVFISHRHFKLLILPSQPVALYLH